jgi:predicted anti-sigma-YlaC factor YlaD
LDGELPELDAVALDRHLTSCADCRKLAAQTAGFTSLLRAAPLAELDHPAVVVAPNRVRRARFTRQAAAGVAAAGTLAAAALGVVIFSGSERAVEDRGAALVFRDLAEQRQFARMEQHRLEPHIVYASGTAPAVSPRALL